MILHLYISNLDLVHECKDSFGIASVVAFENIGFIVKMMCEGIAVKHEPGLCAILRKE